MTKNIYIYADYTKVDEAEITITIPEVENATIIGTETILPGSYGILIITPDDGYMVGSLEATNAKVAWISGNAYMVVPSGTDNITLSCQMKAIPLSETVDVSIVNVKIDTDSGFQATVVSDGGEFPEGAKLVGKYTVSLQNGGIRTLTAEVDATGTEETLTVMKSGYAEDTILRMYSAQAMFVFDDGVTAISIPTQWILATV